MKNSQGPNQDLTGVWQGLYTYPGGGEPVSFIATLIQTGSHLGGTTHETCAVADSSRKALYAMLSGVRQGSAVTFTKSYDGTAGWDHHVHYDGALNGDGTEIEGMWDIDGLLAGKFLMIRSAGKEVEVEHRVFEKV